MHWKRWLGIGAVLAVVIMAIAYGFRPQPVLVETVKAKRGPLRVTVEEEGKTRVTDRYVISAPVASFAPRVRLEVGDPVNKGQTLPELWHRLGDGYRVEARFILWEAQDILQVPNSALFRYQEKWALFTMENGVARRRVVEPGQRNGLVAQIVSGLSEGERVVTHPDALIKDGTSVKESKS